jgi:hypothetical protein
MTSHKEAAMKAVTIRGVDDKVSEKLKSTAMAQGKSVNQLTLEILKEGLGLKKEKKYSREYDDLNDLFGRWSEDQFQKIQSKMNRERQIDPELWK